MFAFKTLIVAFAAIAAAAPGKGVKSTQEVIAECSGNGSGNTVACCNKEQGDTGLNVLGDLLGGACEPVSIPLLAVSLAIPITDYCNAQVACCSGDQTGLVNLQCVPISV
ncbi:uncharacterized protein DNG_09758 [Cephalotrichum gorgonifer]|uniref:Hydrophobin n=1 Tax=Cephalotrichum gorgonifer TaxID=2041049 RepID=A0AAE8SZL2_9PEZI|nr:uncharacterized protein DNG_09758 [Cephalotrichum gorgonifer]